MSRKNFILSWVEHEKCFITSGPGQSSRIEAVLRIIQRLFFLNLNENICCDPSLEPSLQDGSNDGSQHTF